MKTRERKARNSKRKSSLKQSGAITNPLWKKQSAPPYFKAGICENADFFLLQIATSGCPLGGNGIVCVLLGLWEILYTVKAFYLFSSRRRPFRLQASKGKLSLPSISTFLLLLPSHLLIFVWAPLKEWAKANLNHAAQFKISTVIFSKALIKFFLFFRNTKLSQKLLFIIIISVLWFIVFLF